MALPELVNEFIAESFALDPLEATNAGVHDHDARPPGFVYRWHLESVISRGELPLPLLRRALFG